MSTKLLLVTEVAVQADAVDRAAKAWTKVNQDGPAEAQLYRSLEDASILELRPVGGMDEFATLRELWQRVFDATASYLAGDFRRQLQDFVEAPKDTELPLPDTAYVQLRRVEVKPPVMAQYRAWRERTIFETVRRAPESEVFLAYHSLLSTDAGVLFIAGFSGDPEVHNAVYTTPEYREILVQARDNYIVPQGGDRGLFLKTYARIEG